MERCTIIQSYTHTHKQSYIGSQSFGILYRRKSVYSHRCVYEDTYSL